MRLEVRHLELVVAIADCGSLRKAAARLHLTQPAVTTQLKRIEDHLGGALFLRAADGVKPTPAGADFVQEARVMLTQLAALQRVTRRNTQSASAPTRLAGIPAYHFGLLVSALKDNVTSRTIKETGTLTALLTTGELDLAVMRQFPGTPLTLPPNVGHRLLTREPLFVGVPECHPFAQHEEIPLQALADDKWVMPEPDDSGMNAHFARECAKAGFEQRIAHFSSEAHVASTLIRESGAVCPLYPVGGTPPGVARLPVAGNPLVREVVLAWRLDAPVAEEIDDLCEQVAAGYLRLVEESDVYARWWRNGGALFAQSLPAF
ncbi:LysR family transcriptional regulator [Lentzea aerocolonigenes]|uniref:LysR family transcriptional regulator n=1 Tax=Lentzea aerocolonigenes TaxID=68170 RepID=UPI0018C88089|nr:LysR family transcriptional regulator [Lentzea aerocolonigenes]